MGRGFDFGVSQEHVDRTPRQVEPDKTPLNAPPRPGPKSIIVTQMAPDADTKAHEASALIVVPKVGRATPPPEWRFSDALIDESIHELLLKVQKGGSTFWVGAAVPKGTTDFTKAQIFFHPGTHQGKDIIAADEDYQDFKGNWSKRSPIQTRPTIDRYVADRGVQLAKARDITLLVPFTTHAATQTKKGELTAANMFRDRPVDTLNAVMAKVQEEITKKKDPKLQLGQIGVSSFSSGIIALQLFLKAMNSSTLIKEVIDFDSPFITGLDRRLTPFPGALSTCYTQKASDHPMIGYVLLNDKHFENVKAMTSLLPKSRLHHQIGDLMYHQAMRDSLVK
jgi:hypothetical protein